MLVNFFLGDFLSLSVPKCTFPVPNSIEFGAGKVHFCFVSLSASGALQFASAPGARYHKAPPQSTATSSSRCYGYSHTSAQTTTTNHRHQPPPLTGNFCRRRPRACGCLREAQALAVSLWQLGLAVRSFFPNPPWQLAST